MKECRKCNIIKDVVDFYKSDPNNCKECIKERVRENHKRVGNSYDRTYKGVLRVMYKTLKRNQKLRGHGTLKFTKEDLFSWLERNGYKKLYHKYASSGYDKDTKPSIDRLNDFEGYEFSNMRLVTWKDNREHQYSDILSGKGTSGKRCISLLKLDLKGNVLKEYTSFQEVRRLEGYCVHYACKNGITCKKGFIWKEG